MRAARTRVTSIQAKGIAGSILTLHDAATAGHSRKLLATYKYGTEGLEVYIPGSGIIFENGILSTNVTGQMEVLRNYYWSVSSWLTQLLEQLLLIKLFLLMK